MKIERRETTKEGLVQITTLDERWYFNEKKNIYRPSSSWISSYYPKGVEFYKWLASKGWDEAQAIKEAAGEKGSKVHLACELLVKGNSLKMTDKLYNGRTGEEEEITVEEWEAIMSFADWFKATKPEVILTETTIENNKVNYAGTIDLKCKINGEIYIVDYKTSTYIWPSSELQLASYKHAEGMEDVQKVAILQLGYRKNKMGYKFTEIDDAWVYFLAARQIWLKENENVQPKQKDYPMEITLIEETDKIQKLIEEETAKKPTLPKKEKNAKV